MAIKSLYSENYLYELHKDEITKIVLTNHGSDKTTIYKITYTDESILFLGLLEHELEHAEQDEQASIFEYL